MLEWLKVISTFVIGFIFGFGFWYLIFWFITAESNLFIWHVATKVVYLIFSFTATSGIIAGLLDDK